jgi:Fic/DOC family N-terminal
VPILVFDRTAAMKSFQSGRYIQQGYYKSFQPNPIDRVWSLDNMELIQLLGRADRELGRLDMYSEYIPNIDLFISMHVLKEATQSSKIEGTRTNMAEALLAEDDVAPEKRDDWEEVQNYVAALYSKVCAVNISSLVNLDKAKTGLVGLLSAMRSLCRPFIARLGN